MPQKNLTLTILVIFLSEVIETPSYKKLLDEFSLLEKEGKNGRNTLLILGCGKTTSLMLAKEKLSEKYTVKYID